MSKLFRLISLVSLLVMLLASSSVTASIPSGYVRIHYIRTDQVYDGWGLHLWGDGYSGPAITWDSPAPVTGLDDYSCYWDAAYSGSGNLNFIIHNGNLKDPGPDQAFPNPETAKEIYIVSGSNTIYQNLDSALSAAGITNLNIPPVPADCVRLHYCRPDNNYSGWGLHIWGTGYTGPAIDWGAPAQPNGSDTFGVFWDIPYAGTGNIGFIVHNGGAKDPGPDQAFDTSVQENWVISGEATVFNSRLNAAKGLFNRIERAVIIGRRELEIRVRLAISNPVVVKDGAREVQVVATDNSSALIYRVTVNEDLDFTKIYTVSIGNLSATTVVAPEVIDANYAYEGWLGNHYTPLATTFKLWAPLATDVKLLLYSKGDDLNPGRTVQMYRGEQGVWQTAVCGDLSGKFYQYAVTNGGVTKVVLDPYARSMAAFNSDGPDKTGKGAVISLPKTDPAGWERDSYVKLKAQEDAIIYEMSVRDFTIAQNSGVEPDLRGTYLGFIRKIPYLKSLGVTHVQLMPVQNWYYGDENNRAFENTHDSPANYNWGYDPHNYNTPEGWYSTNPSNPYARIKELKSLIQALHKAGIGVVLDVVYNHTATTDILENIVPNYYYRRNPDGSFTAGSGCGNDTASERFMWRKFMVESTAYWVKEYHIDGFRFDLASLHDDTTMKRVAAACRSINPFIELHCEGWDLGTLP
ncbi:MAG: pullulanase-associated domain-containing protein, partial [Bacillota bacterium]